MKRALTLLAIMCTPFAERLRSFGADGLSTAVMCGSDECSFLLEGIPALTLWVDTAYYREVHHQASDTFEKVDPLLLRAGGRSCRHDHLRHRRSGDRIAPRIGQSAVRQILRDAKLDLDLVDALWRP